jgi:hypothetical protein
MTVIVQPLRQSFEAVICLGCHYLFTPAVRSSPIDQPFQFFENVHVNFVSNPNPSNPVMAKHRTTRNYIPKAMDLVTSHGLVACIICRPRLIFKVSRVAQTLSEAELTFEHGVNVYEDIKVITTGPSLEDVKH